MMMTPGVRKLALTTHVTSSVAWLGAVAAFLVLSIAGLTSQNPQTVRSAYIAMNLIGQFMIVPLSFAALLTGLIQSLGTSWGLLQHYWVLTKFALTIVATTLLLLHQFTAVTTAAELVSGTSLGVLPTTGRLGIQLMADAGAAVLVLLVTTTLSVYKPWGRTAYGRQKSDEATLGEPVGAESPRQLPAGLKIFLTIIGLVVMGFVIVHLAGGGLRGH